MGEKVTLFPNSREFLEAWSKHTIPTQLHQHADQSHARGAISLSFSLYSAFFLCFFFLIFLFIFLDYC